MSEWTWINGQPAAGQSASGIDRLANFGDGVFETLRVDQRGIFLAEGHQRRLLAGLERLSLNIDGQALWQQVEALLATAAGKGSGVAKLVVSRAPTTMGYRASSQPAQWLLQYVLQDITPDPRPLGLAVSTVRLARQPALAGIKHCNRLEQVLVRQQLDAAGADEGVVLDTSGQVIEGCAGNLFILEGKALVTPVLSQCGIAGVMREQILQRYAGQCGLSASESTIELPRLMASDGIVLCNSVRGISTVASVIDIDGHRRAWSPVSVLEDLQAQVVTDMSGTR